MHHVLHKDDAWGLWYWCCIQCIMPYKCSNANMFIVHYIYHKNMFITVFAATSTCIFRGPEMFGDNNRTISVCISCYKVFIWHSITALYDIVLYPPSRFTTSCSSYIIVLNSYFILTSLHILPWKQTGRFFLIRYLKVIKRDLKCIYTVYTLRGRTSALLCFEFNFVISNWTRLDNSMGGKRLLLPWIPDW